MKVLIVKEVIACDFSPVAMFCWYILVLARYEVGVIKSIHLLLILASKASTGKTVDCRAWPPFQTHTVKKIFEIKEALI